MSFQWFGSVANTSAIKSLNFPISFTSSNITAVSSVYYYYEFAGDGWTDSHATYLSTRTTSYIKYRYESVEGTFNILAIGY